MEGGRGRRIITLPLPSITITDRSEIADVNPFLQNNNLIPSIV